MKRLLDFVFVFLLLVYPFINMLPDDFMIFGTIWGIVATLFVLLVLLVKKKAINRYAISAFLISIFIFISILLSNEITFLKFVTGYKYILPFLLASYIYWYPLDEKKIHIIYKILFIYLILMIALFLYRLSYVDFNLFMVTMKKDFVWYDNKSHNFAQMYILLCVSFLFFSYLLKKNIYIAYIFFLPIFFVGVRSVILATLLFLIILSTLMVKSYLKAILAFFFIFLSLAIVQPDFKKLTPLILSAQDANRGEDKMTFTSMSSGRDIILDYYMKELDPEKIFVGSGMQFLETNSDFKLGLHNDTLEFFFSFGIFGLFALIFGLYYSIFYDAYKKTHGINRLFIVALIFLFFGISNFAFFIYNQLIIYFYILIFIVKNYQIPRNGLMYENQ
ncbi:conserved membrane hypothetical protein [Sulfurovum sp. enrichment culture clone C5]|uniref:Uncharacterized protein n=1 Tax=Sulfurovum sp. enrichment culture clone C5 TaxID=497650 RepID=A0A0S4XQ62_9BACT|nr:conserved membrane hypothetical protein [Sulfurovum sp. enrichment culture clone C5]